MSSSTPSRVTRSQSAQMSVPTAPGPPVPMRNSSQKSTSSGAIYPSNPFGVDFVLPFSIAVAKGQDRLKTERVLKEEYEALLRALEGEGGLRIASRKGRAGKGKEELWVFVGVGDEKLMELAEREQ